MSEQNVPAFPMIIDSTEYINRDGNKTVEYNCHPGMTLRQWYKGMALQGIMAVCDSDGDPRYHNNDADAEVAANKAGRYADALLAEDAEHEGKE